MMRLLATALTVRKNAGRCLLLALLMPFLTSALLATTLDDLAIGMEAHKSLLKDATGNVTFSMQSKNEVYASTQTETAKFFYKEGVWRLDAVKNWQEEGGRAAPGRKPSVQAKIQRIGAERLDYDAKHNNATINSISNPLHDELSLDGITFYGISTASASAEPYSHMIDMVKTGKAKLQQIAEDKNTGITTVSIEIRPGQDTSVILVTVFDSTKQHSIVEQYIEDSQGRLLESAEITMVKISNVFFPKKAKLQQFHPQKGNVHLTVDLTFSNITINSDLLEQDIIFLMPAKTVI